jgi:hypothetical protein
VDLCDEVFIGRGAIWKYNSFQGSDVLCLPVVGRDGKLMYFVGFPNRGPLKSFAPDTADMSLNPRNRQVGNIEEKFNWFLLIFT